MVFFDDIIDEEIFTYHPIVQNIQGELSKDGMVFQALNQLESIIRNQQANRLSGIIMNPNFSNDSSSNNISGFQFMYKIIKGLEKNGKHGGCFIQPPILFYTTIPFSLVKLEICEDSNSKEIANLSWGEKPQLNSYMSIQSQSQKELDSWLRYVQNK
jgi:hypothetical protein